MECSAELPSCAPNSRSSTDPAKTSKNLILCSVYRLKEMGKELGDKNDQWLYIRCRGRGEHIGCEGNTGDQTDMKWASNGRTRTSSEKWSIEAASSSVSPEALFEGLNWKGLWNTVVKSSEPFLRDCPALYCTVSLREGRVGLDWGLGTGEE